MTERTYAQYMHIKIIAHNGNGLRIIHTHTHAHSHSMAMRYMKFLLCLRSIGLSSLRLNNNDFRRQMMMWAHKMCLNVCVFFSDVTEMCVRVREYSYCKCMLNAIFHWVLFTVIRFFLFFSLVVQSLFVSVFPFIFTVHSFHSVSFMSFTIHSKHRRIWNTAHTCLCKTIIKVYTENIVCGHLIRASFM